MAQRIVRPYDFILDANTGWRFRDDTDSLRRQQGIALNQGAIGLFTESMQTTADLSGTFGGRTLPRGVVIADHSVFIADTTRHRILRAQPCCGPPTPLPTIGALGSAPRQLNQPAGLDINHLGDLVIVDYGNRRLQLISLPHLALRRVIRYEDWLPIDVACGNAQYYIADLAGYVWRLDAQGRRDAIYRGVLPTGWRPLRIVLDREQRAHVIAQFGTQAPFRIFIFDPYGHLMPDGENLQSAVNRWWDLHKAPNAGDPTYEDEAEAREHILPPRLAALVERRAYAWWVRVLKDNQQIDPAKTELQIWQENRDEAYADVLREAYQDAIGEYLDEALPQTRLSLDGNTVLLGPHEDELCTREPMPLDMTVDSTGHLALPRLDAAEVVPPSEDTDPCLTIDSAEVAEVPLPPLPIEGNAPPILRRIEFAVFQSEGLYRTIEFDSGRIGNPWHRVLVDFDAPERTSVRLYAVTTDVLRPDLPSPLEATTVWETSPYNSTEWLFQNNQGRYLYLALVLRGPGDRTPYVNQLIVYSERRSSLQYLPAVFQQDDTSRHLLDRALSLFDTLFDEIETQMDDFPMHLYGMSVPTEFLTWLASWFDLTLYNAWSEDTQREFLRNVIDLHRWRGTIQGLRRALQIHTGLTGDMPGIVEHFRIAKQAGLQPWLGDEPALQNHFSILLPYYLVDTDEKRFLLTRLIDSFKPAHTQYTIRVLQPGIRLGGASDYRSAVGVDTVVMSTPTFRLSGERDEAILGSHTVLSAETAPPASGLLVGRSRLGTYLVGRRQNQPCE